MTSQLGLALKLRDEATYDNFLADEGSSRHRVVTLLHALGHTPGRDAIIYLWGPGGTGRSHLLQAACNDAYRRGEDVQYLPLDELCAMAPSTLLENLEHQSLVCLGNIQAIAGSRLWEEGVFDLYNRIQAAGSHLLISADSPPSALPLQLLDLQSRLCGALVLHLPAYTDEEKLAILQFRAARLGLMLGEDVAGYILNRGDRGLAALMDRLGQLDEASLAEKRRLTIPFVKRVFGW